MICSIWSLFFLSAVTNRKNLQEEKSLPLSSSFYLHFPKGLIMSLSGFCLLVLKITLQWTDKIPWVLRQLTDNGLLLQKEWERFKAKLYDSGTQHSVSEEPLIFGGIRYMDKLWELLSLKVIHITLGKRARVTRKLQAGELFAWVLPVNQKVSGRGEAPVVVSHPQQHSCAQARSRSLFPQLHLFWHTSFSAHSHSMSRTLTLQDPCLPLYIRWDPAPSASSSPLSFLLCWQSEIHTANDLVSFPMVTRTSFMSYLKVVCLLCWASIT